MKLNKLLLCLLSLLMFVSCANDDNDYETVQVASAITLNILELRNSSTILPPQNISESGKIYVKGNSILVNEKNKGIHLII